MSPILLRPIREQFEHDRVIRLLQSRLRRRFAVGANLEEEREAIGVRSGTDLVYPDLVLTSTTGTGARRLHGVVEIETAESVNRLEAMAEWVHLGKVRGAFYLYVPAGATDITLRFCEEYAIAVTEIWSYLVVGDQMRFTMTYRSARAARRALVSSNARTVKRTTKSVKRTTKSVKRATQLAKRTATPTKRAAKPTKRVSKPAKRGADARADRSTAKKSVAKRAETTNRASKKAATGARRQGSSGRKISSRARTSTARSASQARRRSTGAGTKQRTTTFRRSRKHR